MFERITLEVKPCLWCGAQDEFTWIGGDRGVLECRTCGFSTGDGPRASTIKKYNARYQACLAGEEALEKAREGKGWFALTVKQENVLHAFARLAKEKDGKVSLSVLASEVGLRGTGMIRKHMQALESKGYIEIIPTYVGRVWNKRLTHKGQEFVDGNL